MGHKRRGRPASGANLVNNLAGSPHAKRRAELILQTLTGQTPVEQACAELHIGQAAFFKLRARTLQEMVSGLEPRTVGRPPQHVAAEQQRIDELTARTAELEFQLQAARVREELALAGLVPQQRKPHQEASSAPTLPNPDDNADPAGSAGARSSDAPAGPADLKKTNQPPTG